MFIITCFLKLKSLGYSDFLWLQIQTQTLVYRHYILKYITAFRIAQIRVTFQQKYYSLTTHTQVCSQLTFIKSKTGGG